MCETSLKKKIIMLFVILLSAIVTCGLILFGVFLYRSSVKNITQNVESEAEVLQERFENLYNSINECSNITMKSINDIAGSDSTAGMTDVEFLSLHNQLYAAMDYNIRLTKGIKNFAFVDQNGKTVSSSSFFSPGPEDVNQLMQIMPKKKIPKKTILVLLNIPGDSNNSIEQVVAVKQIMDISTGDSLGTLFLVLDQDDLLGLFPSEYEQTYAQKYSLVYQDDHIIVTQEEKQDEYFQENELKKIQNGTGTFKANILHQKNLYIVKSIPSFHSNMVCRLSLDDMNRDTRTTAIVFILVGILIMVIGIIGIYIISGHITQPIRELTEAAEKIQTGDYEVQCNVYTKDEIGILSSTFNQMIDMIKQQMQNIVDKQQIIRKNELAILTEQIKPHFLYNTLGLIHVLCDMNKAEDAGRVAKDLGDFYRSSLSGGNSIISVREELNGIRSYLNIQGTRYRDIITFDIRVHEDIMHCKILKLTLQPIIENSIYHGLKEKDTGGKIRITGWRRKENFMLSVVDNGVGMEKEKLEQLLQENSSHGYGLYNVDQRIKLSFGEDYGLHIASKKNAGTVVTIKLPFMEE